MKVTKKENIIGLGTIKEVETFNGGKVLVFVDGERDSMNDEVDYVVGSTSAVRAYMMSDNRNVG